jgi:hypothetical protein
MMEKSFRKIGRERHCKQCKKSVYMGKEEELVCLEAGLETNGICTGEQKVQRVCCGDRKRIGHRKVPSIYQHAHRDRINPLKYWD